MTLGLTLLTAMSIQANDLTQGLLLVCNKGDHTLGLVDPVAGRMIATVPEDGITGHEVAASPDGRLAYVPIYSNTGVGRPGTDGRLIRVIDLASRAVTATIDLGKGLRPHCAVMGPQNRLLYVTTELAEAITVIDPKTLQVTGTIPTGRPESHMLAITRDGRRGYTANVGSGTVSVLDLAAQKLLTVIPVCPVTQRIALSVDDRWVFTSDQTQPRLAVIDTQTNGLRRWIPLPGIGYGSAPRRTAARSSSFSAAPTRSPSSTLRPWRSRKPSTCPKARRKSSSARTGPKPTCPAPPPSRSPSSM